MSVPLRQSLRYINSQNYSDLMWFYDEQSALPSVTDKYVLPFVFTTVFRGSY